MSDRGFSRTWANFLRTLSDDRLLFAADLAKAANVPGLAKKRTVFLVIDLLSLLLGKTKRLDHPTF